jgi:hypothetical protein
MHRKAPLSIYQVSAGQARIAARFEKVADQSQSLGNSCRDVASGTCKVSATTGYTAGFLERFRDCPHIQSMDVFGNMSV